ncbi:hypothetical protein [Dyadobacter crusticola]|uniref:hypothetical protein n=1 Tax=Dyadobacter crusticola TaxID=292407 RepID=UPI000AFFEC8A|nr:hypothetical protein [Dyadobacter crusticola]
MLRNETKLEVIIQEVDDSVVKYKKVNDQEGPLFTIKKADIVSIQYGNGEVETFEATLEVPNYYAPSSAAPRQVPAASSAMVPRGNKFQQELQTSSSDHLRGIYKYYKTKSKNGLAIGIAGTSAGLIFMGIGTGIIAKIETDANGNFLTYADEQKAIRGAWMIIGGFAGAATFGTVGFVKAGRNGSKAGKIRRELLQRGEPIVFKFSPGFNARTQTGFLTVNVQF